MTQAFHLISIGQFPRFVSAFCVLVAFLFTPEVIASPPGFTIEDHVKSYLSEYSKQLEEKNFRTEYEIGNIDPRLNKKSCSVPLEYKLNQDPTRQVNNTVLVNCTSRDQPWKFFVRAKIRLYGKAVSAKMLIPRGSVIERSALVLEEQLVNQISYESLQSINQVAGMIARHTIRAGNMIRPANLKAPNLVNRGDLVLISAGSKSINVRMNGIALTDGKLGQQIPVRNQRSKRVIKAVVKAKGEVEVYL